MSEEWRQIRGYEGIYSVSSHGRVRRDLKGRGAVVGRILKPYNSHGGYVVVDLNTQGFRAAKKVHSIVMDTFAGKRPDGLQVNHKDGIKKNNHIDNLEYVTPRENMLHSYKTGLRVAKPMNLGENNGMSVLTRDDVLEIRELLSDDNLTQREIAKIYGVRAPLISRINTRKRWGWL